MNQPNYILKTKKLCLIGVESKLRTYLRRLLPLLWLAYNIWNWYRKGFTFSNVLFFLLILLGLGMWALYGTKSVRSSEYFELQFYDDEMTCNVPIRTYSDGLRRQEVCTVKYNEITQFAFNQKSKEIRIFGPMYYTWHKIDDNNQPIEPPERDQFSDDFAFITFLADDVEIDFVGIVEANSPIKVEVRDW